LPISTPYNGKIAWGPYTIILPYRAISPAKWPFSTTNREKIAGRPIYSYFTCTVAHKHTPQWKKSLGAHIQLFYLHSGPSAHPTKEK
jgi:hypothetical protein